MLNTAIKFEDYLEKAAQAKTKDELFAVYRDTVASHGFDRILFCLANDHSDIGENAGASFLHNFPEDWMKYYFEQGFDKIDPVLIYSFSQIGSYTWDEIPTRMALIKPQENCLNLGIESGLNNGICTPLRGPNGALAGLSLASSQKTDAVEINPDLITAYSNHFYLAYRRLGQNENNRPKIPNVALTDKERDILCWVARAKSQTDIGVILNLSPHAINYHMRNIFTKLEVNDKVLAVVKAMTYGLIQP